MLTVKWKSNKRYPTIGTMTYQEDKILRLVEARSIAKWLIMAG